MVKRADTSETSSAPAVLYASTRTRALVLAGDGLFHRHSLAAMLVHS